MSTSSPQNEIIDIPFETLERLVELQEAYGRSHPGAALANANGRPSDMDDPVAYFDYIMTRASRARVSNLTWLEKALIEGLRIDLTKKQKGTKRSRKQHLKARLKSFGIGTATLFNSISYPPESLTFSTLDNVVNGRTKTMLRSDWDLVNLVLDEYSPEAKIDLRQNLRGASFNRSEWLKAKMKEKNVGAYLLFNSIENPPEGLTANIIEDIANGNVDKTKAPYWRAIKRAIRDYEPRVYLTEALPGTNLSRIEWLKKQFKRKEINAHILFQSIENPPKDLTHKVIRNWLHSKELKRVKQEHWDIVEKATRAHAGLINLERRSESRSRWLRKRLDGRAKRPATFLFKRISDPPPGLRAPKINECLTGKRKKIKREEWCAIKKAARELDAPQNESIPKPLAA